MRGSLAMVDRTALVVLAFDFLVIGALPRFFFRSDGRFNVRWWATAAPFFLCPVFVIAAALQLLPVSLRWAQLLPGQHLAAAVFNLFSIALTFFTLGTHRIPIALWHQPGDAPRQIVTWGAYARIRHPFYASFLLGFIGCCLLFPHPIVLALSLYTFVVLDRTAAGEERRLAASEFGREYTEYRSRTGRFLPRWSRG
jgi:protein-S-isoprenylcysteine O-methyltransferase Ste14